MKKIVFIILTSLTLNCYSQNPIPISQPYNFLQYVQVQKYIYVKDSVEINNKWWSPYWWNTFNNKVGFKDTTSTGKIDTKAQRATALNSYQKKSDTATYDASKYYVQQLLNSYIKWVDTLSTGKIATKKYVADHSGGSSDSSKLITKYDFTQGVYGEVHLLDENNINEFAIQNDEILLQAKSILGASAGIYADTFGNAYLTGSNHTGTKTTTYKVGQNGLEATANYYARNISNPGWLVDKNALDSTVAANSGGSFGDSILKFDAIKKTFVPYSSKQNQLSFYNANTWPDKTDDTLKLNGIYCPTGLHFRNGGRIWDFTLQGMYGYPEFNMFENNNILALGFNPNNGNYLFNNVTPDSVFGMTFNQQDSIRFQATSFFTKMGDITKNNYINVDYKGRLTQVIGGVTKTVLSTSGDLTLAGDLKYKVSHGDAVISGASYVPSLTVNVPLKLVPSMTVKESDSITIAGDTVTIAATRGGDYKFRIYGNISSVSGNDFVINERKNSVVIDVNDYFECSTTGATNFTPIAYEWYTHGLVAGDKISWWITNTTNSDDPTIRSFKVIVEKVPDKI